MSHRSSWLRLARVPIAVAALAMAMLVGGGSRPAFAEPPASKINHLIVVYQENWSFDGLFGTLPGVNGIANAASAPKQVDKSGTPYATLPQPIDTGKKGPDPRFPTDLPNALFDASKYVPVDQRTGDLVHRYYQERLQIDGGRMDKFVQFSDAAGLAMSYFDSAALPLGKLAAQYTVADNWFHSAFGGSFLNHFWLVCACTPSWPNAPASQVAQVNEFGGLIKDGAVTPDGYAVNTSFTVNSPHPANITDPALLVPNQVMPNIGDRLSEKGISWAWYSGGWNDALAGHADPLFQYHHQPFAYFANYADGTRAKAEHLRDMSDFFGALKGGSLPAVSFVKPLGPDNEHPGYTDELRGQQYVANLVQQVQASPYWKDTAIVVTYDENGGRYDHVAPPPPDRWGPGTRIPALIISPYARKGYVDHTQYETVSILKFIEERWGLDPLAERDARANSFVNAFDFSQVAPGPPNTGSGLATVGNRREGAGLAAIAALLAGFGVYLFASKSRMRPGRS